MTFHYPDGTENVLEHFNLDVPRGHHRGHCGGDWRGQIHLGEPLLPVLRAHQRPGAHRTARDYRERSQLWLHSNIGYVLQTPHLFSGTVKENIRYGRLDATDEEIVAAAKLVNAHDFITHMEHGYDSDVGEGGVPALHRGEAADFLCPGGAGQPQHLRAGRGHRLHRHQDRGPSSKRPSPPC